MAEQSGSYPVHVAAACDDRYARWLAVSLASLSRIEGKTPLTAHIIVDGVGDANRNLLSNALGATPGNSCRFYEMDGASFAGAPLMPHFTLTTYLRLYLADVLPADVVRVLYLDCDLLVCSRIDPLFDLDLGGNAVAAVEDAVFDQHSAIGLEPGLPYFNAGVMLIDLPRWREHGVKEKAFALIASGLRTPFADQCFLNLALAHTWQPLSYRWNQQRDMFTLKLWARRFRHLPPRIQRDMAQAILNPNVIHFTGADKPWQDSCTHPLRGRYRRAWRADAQRLHLPAPPRWRPTKSDLRFYVLAAALLPRALAGRGDASAPGVSAPRVAP